ncbi:hypothetical protein PCANC_04264 [Puccinia coronata f. sp. avenae]|uniref:Required for respiratory growth protein 9, mitochondrial n=1 Tax=Puccinia coronata f. sp. avenae TaxID=200324 RepID=A0A2N5V2Z9_9BASI|nr:hypothetical protein PCANC_26946 [Puccinia coronata f. sp. avenae]PLW22118.1 hypothetical protein PCASD_15129 [Puccinia coronata f. sp. avenae]PLW44364.1 hypothetical protein PCASD_04522 [Puccinia coronata f. sp. avenae]PLW54532.1 hypothetical protein PCANC_04264 [Puccinia coronata f. sp. avenae]
MQSTLRRSIGITGSPVRHQRLIRSPPPAGPLAGPSRSNRDAEETLEPANIRSKTSQEKPHWLIQKEALRRNFPDGWNPPKKISRPSMALLRTLHRSDPEQFSLPVLSEKFKISPEAVRRILKSKWEPDQNVEKKAEHRLQTGAARSPDGWVHHETLETDQIPLNLAHTLQSSPQHNPKHSSFPVGRPHSQRSHNGSFFRSDPNRTFSPMDANQGKYLDKGIQHSSESSPPAAADNTLGSAFQQTPDPPSPRTRRRIISKCVRLLLIQPEPVWTDELEGLRILSLFDDLCFLNSQSTAPDLLHLQLEVKLQMILDRVTSHLFRHSSVLCFRQVLPVRLANLPAGKTISNGLWSSKLQYWSALPD